MSLITKMILKVPYTSSTNLHFARIIFVANLLLTSRLNSKPTAITCKNLQLGLTNPRCNFSLGQKNSNFPYNRHFFQPRIKI